MAFKVIIWDVYFIQFNSVSVIDAWFKLLINWNWKLKIKIKIEFWKAQQNTHLCYKLYMEESYLVCVIVPKGSLDEWFYWSQMLQLNLDRAIVIAIIPKYNI